MVCVILTCLPGYSHRALVSPETAAELVRLNMGKLLEDPRPKTPMREAKPGRL